MVVTEGGPMGNEGMSSPTGMGRIKELLLGDRKREKEKPILSLHPDTTKPYFSERHRFNIVKAQNEEERGYTYVLEDPKTGLRWGYNTGETQVPYDDQDPNDPEAETYTKFYPDKVKFVPLSPHIRKKHQPN